MSVLPSIFCLREHPTKGIINLLDSTELGTNGAIYRHLDTRERIKEIDHPLYLSAERNENVLGNITFCRREKEYYIRYFAFKESIRSGKNRKPKERKGVLKQGIESFFKSNIESGRVESFYAYIEPGNLRSLVMSEDYNFSYERTISTQTFSRTNPKERDGFVELDKMDPEVQEIISKNYKDHSYYHPIFNLSMRCFGIKKNKTLVAIACVNVANWEMVRLPGFFGGIVVKAIPYLPVIRRLITPKQHRFAVLDNVCLHTDHPELAEELFESILFELKLNTAFWWVDSDDETYNRAKKIVRWGLLHKLVGVNSVNLVSRKSKKTESKPAYVLGLDFI